MSENVKIDLADWQHRFNLKAGSTIGAQIVGDKTTLWHKPPRRWWQRWLLAPKWEKE